VGCGTRAAYASRRAGETIGGKYKIRKNTFLIFFVFLSFRWHCIATRPVWGPIPTQFDPEEFQLAKPRRASGKRLEAVRANAQRPASAAFAMQRRRLRSA